MKMNKRGGFFLDWALSGSYSEAQKIKLMKKIGKKVDGVDIKQLQELLKKK